MCQLREAFYGISRTRSRYHLGGLRYFFRAQSGSCWWRYHAMHISKTLVRENAGGPAWAYHLLLFAQVATQVKNELALV